jgi:hypothetical protein
MLDIDPPNPEETASGEMGDQLHDADGDGSAGGRAMQDDPNKVPEFNLKEFSLEAIGYVVGTGFIGLLGEFLEFIGVHGSKPWCILGALLFIEFGMAHLLVKYTANHDRKIKVAFCVVALVETVIICIVVFTANNPSKSAKWQPPELPPKCEVLSVEYGSFATYSFTVSNLNAQPNQTVRQTNHFGGSGAVTFDVRYGIESTAVTDASDEVKKSFHLKNALTNAFIPIHFSVTLKKNRMHVGFSAVTDFGEIRIENGEPPQNLPRSWDWNRNPSAVEVVNDFGNPICRIFYKNPYTVRLESFNKTNGVYIIFGENVFGIGDWPPPKNSEKQTGLKPLFKYPSWQYPGVYAE